MSAPVRFGVITDVQYGDKPAKGRRRYRDSLAVLDRALDAFRAAEVAFCVHLGDLIDGRTRREDARADLDAVLGRFAAAGIPVHHVLGNHCCDAGRPFVLQRLGVPATRRFTVSGWRLLVLDGVRISTCAHEPTDPRYWAAQAWRVTHPRAQEPSNERWNGGLGAAQRDWLAAELAAASAAAMPVVVLCHQAVADAAASPRHRLWDRARVLPLLPESSCVAWLSGHDHDGGHARVDGIHHVTFEGAVETDVGDACHAIVTLEASRCTIDGAGRVRSRILPLRSR